MPAVTLENVYVWLWTYVAADATLQGYIGTPARFYRRIAEEDAGFPQVVVQVDGTDMLKGLGPQECGGDALLTVRGTADGPDWDPLAPVMARLHMLLQAPYGAPGAQWTGVVACSTRRSQQDGLDDVEGRLYAWVSAHYDLQLRAS